MRVLSWFLLNVFKEILAIRGIQTDLKKKKNPYKKDLSLCFSTQVGFLRINTNKYSRHPPR